MCKQNIFLFQVDDDADDWDEVVTGVTVGPDGALQWPPLMGSDLVDIGVIKIVPEEPTSINDELYYITLDIVGCRERGKDEIIY